MEHDEDQKLLEALDSLSVEELRRCREKVLRSKRRIKRKVLPYLVVEWAVLAIYCVFVLFIAAAPFVAAYHLFGGSLAATMILGMAGLYFVTRAADEFQPKFEWLYSTSSCEHWTAEWDRLGSIQTQIEGRLFGRDPTFDYFASSTKRSLEDLRWGARHR